MLIRFFVPWIALAGVLGFALGGSCLWASLHPHTVFEVRSGLKANSPDHQAGEDKGSADHAIAEYTYWLMLFTGALAVATIGLGFATMGLYLTGEKQVGAASKAAEAALLTALVSKASIRAVVTVRNFQATLLTDQKTGTAFAFSLSPRIENTGNTHAVNVATACSGRMVEPADEDTFRFQLPPGGGTRSSVGPRTVVQVFQNPSILAADASRIWRGEQKYLLWCRVDYQDILGDPHHVESCVSVGFRLDPILTPPDVIVRDNEFVTYMVVGPQNSAG